MQIYPSNYALTYLHSYVVTHRGFVEYFQAEKQFDLEEQRSQLMLQNADKEEALRHVNVCFKMSYFITCDFAIN